MFLSELLFLSQTQRIKKKQVTSIINSFSPYVVNLQNILMPKVILVFCHKKSTHLDHSYHKYALDAKKRLNLPQT